MSLNKRQIILIHLGALLFFLALNAYFHFNHQAELEPKFPHISPDIAWMETDEFLDDQSKYSLHYMDLRERIDDVLSNSTEGEFGIYFEDLNTGAWIGINERESFIPASLLKPIVLVATLKKVEKKELSLNQTITVLEQDLDYVSGSLGYKGAGYQLTLKELLVYLIKESDNTAFLTLGNRYLSQTELHEAKLAMGLSELNSSGTSPKGYSNIFRGLYYSVYLRRTFSELALSLMSETDYSSQIPAGIPKNIAVSHKVGYHEDEENRGIHHDCGIVYYPNKPYVLCVMSKDTTDINADLMISKISKIVYEHAEEMD